MEKTTLFIPVEIIAAINELAQRHGRSRGDLMREALQEYVEKHDQKLSDWIGIIDSEGEFDSTNVKAWLRDKWKPD
jgi:metal-responsive CopG/Arc/MetJ family transcriptional regulator